MLLALSALAALSELLLLSMPLLLLPALLLSLPPALLALPLRCRSALLTDACGMIKVCASLLLRGGTDAELRDELEPGEVRLAASELLDGLLDALSCSLFPFCAGAAAPLPGTLVSSDVLAC